MSNLAIRVALTNALDAMTPVLQTCYENENFNNNATIPYQVVNLLPADVVTPEMSRTLAIKTGIFHVLVCYPLSQGVGYVNQRALLLEATFRRGTSFTNNGYTVTIKDTPGVGQGRVGLTHYELPVRIRYYANTTPL